MINDKKIVLSTLACSLALSGCMSPKYGVEARVKAIDQLAKIHDEYGSVSMSAPILVAKTEEFKFDLKNGADEYFESAKNELQGQAASSSSSIEISSVQAQIQANIDQILSRNVLWQQFMRQKQDYLTQKYAYDNNQQLSEKILDNLATRKLKQSLADAALKTDKNERLAAIESAYKLYLAETVKSAPSNSPDLPNFSDKNLPDLPTEATHHSAKDIATSLGKELDLLTSLNKDAVTNRDRTAIITAAGDTVVEGIFRIQGNIDGLNEANSDRHLLYGISMISIEPGRKSRQQFEANLQIAPQITYIEARSRLSQEFELDKKTLSVYKPQVKTSKALASAQEDLLTAKKLLNQKSSELNKANAEKHTSDIEEGLAKEKLEKIQIDEKKYSQAQKSSKDVNNKMIPSAHEAAQKALMDAKEATSKAKSKVDEAEKAVEKAKSDTKTNEAKLRLLSIGTAIAHTCQDIKPSGLVNVSSISPMTDIQNMDLASSQRHAKDKAQRMALALSAMGFKIGADSFNQYVEKLEQDIRTRTPLTPVSAYSNGDTFGYRIGPTVEALTDVNSKTAGNVLQKQSFPALLIIQLEKKDLELKQTLNGHLCEPALVFQQKPTWISMRESSMGISEAELITLKDILDTSNGLLLTSEIPEDLMQSIHVVDIAISNTQDDQVPTGIDSNRFTEIKNRDCHSYSWCGTTQEDALKKLIAAIDSKKKSHEINVELGNFKESLATRVNQLNEVWTSDEMHSRATKRLEYSQMPYKKIDTGKWYKWLYNKDTNYFLSKTDRYISNREKTLSNLVFGSEVRQALPDVVLEKFYPSTKEAPPPFVIPKITKVDVSNLGKDANEGKAAGVLFIQGSGFTQFDCSKTAVENQKVISLNCKDSIENDDIWALTFNNATQDGSMTLRLMLKDDKGSINSTTFSTRLVSPPQPDVGLKYAVDTKNGSTTHSFGFTGIKECRKDKDGKDVCTNKISEKDFVDTSKEILKADLEKNKPPHPKLTTEKCCNH